MATIPIALQLYTVREEAERDFVGTLRQVAALGYAGVEFAGYGGLPAGELKALLAELGLAAAGSHVPLQALETDLDQVVDYSLALGNHYLVCPWLPEDRRQDYHRLAARLNGLGARCRERDLQLCYHNHAFEFQRFDGAYGYDILLDETDPALLHIELDIYWVRKAGEDPARYLRRLGKRCPLVHLKDMTADSEQTFAEVGTGSIDFAPLLAASAAHARWYIVEQDACRRPPLESAAISLRNLQAMGNR